MATARNCLSSSVKDIFGGKVLKDNMFNLVLANLSMRDEENKDNKINFSKLHNYSNKTDMETMDASVFKIFVKIFVHIFL